MSLTVLWCVLDLDASEDPFFKMPVSDFVDGLDRLLELDGCSRERSWIQRYVGPNSIFVDDRRIDTFWFPQSWPDSSFLRRRRADPYQEGWWQTPVA